MTQSLSEQYRLAARKWVELNCAAKLLEETKEVNRSQMMMGHGDIAGTKARMLVTASPQYSEFIMAMVEARRLADLAKVDAEFIKMRHSEQMSEEATTRREMGL